MTTSNSVKTEEEVHKLYIFPGYLDPWNSNMVSKIGASMNESFGYVDDPYFKTCIHIRKVDTMSSRTVSFTFFGDNLVIK